MTHDPATAVAGICLAIFFLGLLVCALPSLRQPINEPDDRYDYREES